MDSSTLVLLGGILIAASATLALLAYAIWRSRRMEQGQEEGEGGEATASEAGAGPAAVEERPEPAAPMPMREAPSPEPAKPAAATPASTPPPTRPAPAMPQAPSPVAAAAPPPPRHTIPVASLFRDESSGGLVICIDDREYRSAADLMLSKDRQRMEHTAAELNRWLGMAAAEAAVPMEMPGKSAAKPAPRPVSMVEQINKILDRKLAGASGGPRGVRLAEGSGGSLRVYVGVDGYNAIDDVPDEEARRMIREAVAEWEASQ